MLFKDVLLHIIELFNRNECFLLRDMYHFYCERIGFHFKDDIDMLTSEKKTSNWLLSSYDPHFTICPQNGVAA